MIGAIAEAVELLGEVGETDAASAASSGSGDWLSLKLPLPLKKSSCVASASYSIGDGELNVTFQSGSTYDYPSISIITVLRWLAADSVGTYFHENIGGK